MADHLASNSMLGSLIQHTTPIIKSATLTRDSYGNTIGIDGFSVSNKLITSKPWENPQPATMPPNLAVYYKLDEGIGNMVHDSIGGGPALLVQGDTSKIWDNPGWLTFGVDGNPIQAANDPYINELIKMDGFGGSIIVAFDIHMSTWPTATEAIWSMWRAGNTIGGIRGAMVASVPNRVGTYWSAPGGSDLELFSYNEVPIGQKTSVVIELDFSMMARDGILSATYFLNGDVVRCRTTITAAPPSDTISGLIIGGYGTTSGYLTKLGSNTGGTSKLANFFVMRCQNHDPRIAYYLADHTLTRVDSSLPVGIRSL